MQEYDDPEKAIVVPIEDSIDLHTFRPSEVQSVVEEYLDAAGRRGFPVVRIIHGRGIGVQREIVQSILKRHPGVVGYADAPDRGATVVQLASTPERVAQKPDRTTGTTK